MFSVTFRNTSPNYKNVFVIRNWSNFKIIYFKYIFLWRFETITGYGLPLRDFLLTLIGNTALSTTPVDEISAQSRHLYMTKNNSHKIQTSVSPGGFEPTFQQASVDRGES